MSVTLKLSDGDANLIGSILGRVHSLVEAEQKGTESVPHLKSLIHMAGGSKLSVVKELEGTFNTAVRANSR